MKPRGVNKAHPFCGPRCKSIDLGKWLSEDYRVPTDDAVVDGVLGGHADDDDSPPKPDMRH